MSASAKNKGPLWYGYLEAGNKSSAVIRDDRLDTGSRKTVFLFNLERKQIIEYTREIVDPKLRELKSSEAKLIDELNAAYTEARRAFKHAQARPLNIPERGAPAKAAKANEEEALGDFGGGAEDEGAWVDSTEEEEG
ncbi:MAG TPA: hypothetical protein VIR60_03935 [Gammaproteobacteria bacterium]